jgi:enoyl-CoA hydratase
VPEADDVQYREADGVAYITLNRPAKLNALGPNSFRLLDEHIARFTASPAARVAILHGNGRAFAAGADIEHYVGLTALDYADFMRFGNAVQQHLIDCPKPVIAAVHGFALGGGLELALCCDLIVAEPDAQLGLPEARLGLLPGGGGTQRLPRLIGSIRAAELIMTAWRISGTQAVAWGLALGTGESASALEAAQVLARRITAAGPVAVRMAKTLLREGADAPLAAGLKLEQAVGAVLYGTEDAREGITAFVEKRKPQFNGRLSGEVRMDGLTVRGRPIYGATAPGEGVPCARESALTSEEVAEVAAIIAGGRLWRRAAELPGRLRTRDWGSVVKVILAVDALLGRAGAGWKVGAASDEVRRAEGLPSPSPGVIYADTIFTSGSLLPGELFVNFRCCESEFAFQLGLDFPVRAEPYSEADARAGIDTMFPALEIGDCVFTDWYGASGYFGSCLDNGGGAALVTGRKTRDWADFDLPRAGMDLYLDGHYIKSGQGSAAMGHPVTSLTWMLNWAREQGRPVRAGDVVSTGTCTGHLFAAPGDTVRADFGAFGVVEARFA